MRAHALTQRALQDLSAARDYYDRAGVELGNRFIDRVFAAIDVARERPESCPGAPGGVRTIRCRRFPYRVYFKVETDRVLVLAVYHTARDPDRWDDSSRG